MAFVPIDNGSFADDPSADNLFDAFNDTNANFAELYAQVNGGANVYSVGPGGVYSTINAAANARRAAGYKSATIVTGTANQIQVGNQHRLWRFTDSTDLTNYIGQAVGIEWSGYCPVIAWVIAADEILMKSNRQDSSGTGISLEVFTINYATIFLTPNHKEVIGSLSTGGVPAVDLQNLYFTNIRADRGTTVIMSEKNANPAGYVLAKFSGSELRVDGLNFTYNLDFTSGGAGVSGGVVVTSPTGGLNDYSADLIFSRSEFRAGQQDAFFLTSLAGVNVFDSFVESEWDCIRQFNGRALNVDRCEFQTLVRRNYNGSCRVIGIGTNSIPIHHNHDVDVRNSIIRGYDDLQTGAFPGTYDANRTALVELYGGVSNQCRIRVHDNYFESSIEDHRVVNETEFRAVAVYHDSLNLPPAVFDVYDNLFNMKNNDTIEPGLDNIDKQGAAAVSGTFDNTAAGTIDFVAAGFQVGNTIQTSGYVDTANNGFGVITAVTANSITADKVGGNWGAAETGTGNEEIKRFMFQGNSELISSDSANYVINQWNNRVVPGSMDVNGSNVNNFPVFHGRGPEGYGGLYIANGSTAQGSLTGTPVKFALWSANLPAQNMTPVFGSNDIYVDKAGVYKAAFHLAFTGTTNGQFDFELYVDGVATGLIAERKLGTGTDVGSCSFSGLVTIPNDGAYVDVRVAATTGTSITAVHAQLVLTNP